MKKIAAALCSILFVSSLSFGLEWGGTFGNGTSFIGRQMIWDCGFLYQLQKIIRFTFLRRVLID